MSNFDTLLQVLQTLPSQAMLRATNYDAEMNDSNTHIYNAGRYRVFITNSAYVADFVLNINGKFVFVTFSNNDVIIGTQHRYNEWNIEKLQALVDEKFIAEAIRNIEAGMTLGDFPANAGKQWTLWEFHSNAIFLKK